MQTHFLIDCAPDQILSSYIIQTMNDKHIKRVKEEQIQQTSCLRVGTRKPMKQGQYDIPTFPTCTQHKGQRDNDVKLQLVFIDLNTVQPNTSLGCCKYKHVLESEEKSPYRKWGLSRLEQNAEANNKVNYPCTAEYILDVSLRLYLCRTEANLQKQRMLRGVY